MQSVSMNALDPDFDFLSYLDASLVDGPDASFGGEGSSSSLTSGSGHASPHDGASSSGGTFSAAHTQYAATSPSASSASAGSTSFPRSPLFASTASAGNSYGQLHQQQSPSFGGFDFSASVPASHYANSPSFDTSIFANLQDGTKGLQSYNFAQHVRRPMPESEVEI